MADEYLWDRSGPPDAEIAGLETLLAPYACPPARRPRYGAMALAATVMIACASALYVAARPAQRPSAWTVDGRAVRVGEIVQTRAGGEAVLAASAVGELRLAGNSRLRVTRSHSGQQRMTLTRGTMHALIWAPPTEFIVDTPSATTIDLGCEYDLQVSDDGAGWLTVRHGWVAFQAGDRESFIPAGAVCRTTRRGGPGLPYFEDASPALREAVAAYDRGGPADAVLAAATPRDALTVWHLLRRSPAPQRARVTARLAELAPGVTASTSVEAAWDALGFGDTSWWRKWKRNW